MSFFPFCSRRRLRGHGVRLNNAICNFVSVLRLIRWISLTLLLCQIVIGLLLAHLFQLLSSNARCFRIAIRSGWRRNKAERKTKQTDVEKEVISNLQIYWPNEWEGIKKRNKIRCLVTWMNPIRFVCCAFLLKVRRCSNRLLFISSLSCSNDSEWVRRYIVIHSTVVLPYFLFVYK